jgi:hypothetical protein
MPTVGAAVARGSPPGVPELALRRRSKPPAVDLPGVAQLIGAASPHSAGGSRSVCPAWAYPPDARPPTPRSPGQVKIFVNRRMAHLIRGCLRCVARLSLSQSRSSRVRS